MLKSPAMSCDHTCHIPGAAHVVPPPGTPDSRLPQESRYSAKPHSLPTQFRQSELLVRQGTVRSSPSASSQAPAEGQAAAGLLLPCLRAHPSAQVPVHQDHTEGSGQRAGLISVPLRVLG